MKRNFAILILAGIYLYSCKSEQSSDLVIQEKYRPQFHFTPKKNWINDPNGLVFYEGEYHLFYQYNPYATTWGHMSWGHAVSRDMINWEHLPIALEEYLDPTTGDSTMIFSGTAVVDNNNTSGLCEGKDCLIAIYTSNLHRDNQGLRQHQSLAYSNDKGRTWKRYDKNPILDIQRKDFRDPKVFWYEPQQKWVMALVVPDLFTVQLYESKNLLKWDLMSEFGKVGDTLRIWECPDLYELPIEGQPGKTQWVLSLSGGHPAGPTFVGMQYFVGDFDGKTFKTEQTTSLYLEHGKDYYAGIIFNNVTDRTVMLGWINNWTYANQIPTETWRGAFSIPRELKLTETPEGLRLSQHPIVEFNTLREDEIGELNSLTTNSFELELEIPDGGGVHLFKSDTEQTTIGYQEGKLYLDRSKSGNVTFQKDFASVESIAINSKQPVITVTIIVDQSIIEVISNDGLYAITDQVFPTSEKSTIELFGNSQVKKGWRLKSIIP
ncbi:MAG: glycoside hydrolase family 32 protein [Cyclobacteriaceae bacterium]